MSNLFVHKLAELVRLSEQQRLEVESLMGQVRSFDRRHSDICEGDPGAVIVMLSGWASHCRLLPDGHRQITALLLPGDICDLSYSWGLGHSQVVESLTPVSLVRLPIKTLRRSGEMEKIFESALYRQTRIALEIQREWTISLGHRTATKRLAHLFCELSHRLRMAGLAHGTVYDMPLTQRDLGEALGASIVHINRTLQNLRSSGLIELKRRRLEILDHRRLAQLARFDPSYLGVMPNGSPLP